MKFINAIKRWFKHKQIWLDYWFNFEKKFVSEKSFRDHVCKEDPALYTKLIHKYHL